jgi:hypothetical protein
LQKVKVVVACSAARAGKLSKYFLYRAKAVRQDVEGGRVCVIKEGLVDGHQLRSVDRIILREA